MSRIVRWNPFREIVDMQRQLDQIFDQMGSTVNDSDWTSTGNWLALDVHENDNAYMVEADLPGINPDNIDITLHENTLTISAETVREDVDESQRQLISERRYGRFQRSVRLPDSIDADNVEANYDNGVLTLTLPKSEASKPRQIAVNNTKLLTNEN